MKLAVDCCQYLGGVMGGGCFLLLVSFMLTSVMLGMFADSTLMLIEWEYFKLCGLCFSVLIMVDLFGVLFSSLVCLIGGCVLVFSVSYMGGSKFMGEFFYLTMCFILVMNFLIFIPCLVFLLVGWDLLGVISFLLVIYYQSKSSVSAGMMTVLVNRIGDILLLLSVGLGSSFGGWDGFNASESGISSLVVVVGVLLVMAAMTKSAQFPFSVWLPAAMAAPTPISALVHSSTLVVGGVYLLFRYYSFLGAIDGLLLSLSKVGCLTLLVASFMACFEFDIKKLVALSTLGHLGFMIYVLGLGYPVFSFFHMLSHAMFKALLFLCVGYYIHNTGHYLQDARQLCGIGWVSSPVLVSCSVVGFSSLCGLPYLSGFYSKHAILESSISSLGGGFELLCLVFGAAVSCFYSVWVLLWVVFGACGSYYLGGVSCDDRFVVSVYLLAMGSVFLGYLGQSVLVEFCDIFVISFDSKMVLFLSTSVVGVVSTIGWFMVWFYSNYSSEISSSKTFLFFSSMWFLKYLFGRMPSFWWVNSVGLVKVLEVGWIESLSVGVFGGLSLLSGWVWSLERISILVLVRVGVVIILFMFTLWS
uniref:NADH:ubiquinone reductase (H(+)-translocating) n=1 Tax=Potamilus alatus TaxID=81573 RepID=A0A1P8AJ34_9BIVA|nr:NADH dehydrogenase subunit 5 [Potamilus alatus]AMZ00191.1 NADH dehydrogenase subunit 5 [Potamilus alatus]